MPRTRIVAVDDDRRILRVLKRACENVGYEVHSVVDAEYFRSSFRAFEPSLVFLDLNMRGTDGIALLRFIAGERTDTSVVVTSGVDERMLDEAQSQGLSLGLRMLTPIRKPLMVADVHHRLAAFRGQPVGQRRACMSATDLADALDRGHLDVCYQPLVNLATEQVVGVEALARLRRPGAGVLAPESFISVAEQCGLIDSLTFGVLDRALSRLAGWREQAPELCIAVNISPTMLADASLPERIAAALHAHGVDAERLVIEITESGVASDRSLAAETLGRLKQSGVRLALDDFGSGFCSLGQLYEFPYDTLKLDRKFAMRAQHDEEAAATIRSCLDLARAVGLNVVAEGVQSEVTLRWLAMQGCHLAQGYHISPPLFAAEFTTWLSERAAAWLRPPLSLAPGSFALN